MSIELLLHTDVFEISRSINSIFILFASFLVFFMQPGFALLEVGQVQSKNAANVAMKNLVDWSQGVICFFLIGAGVAYLAGGITSPGSVSVTSAFAYTNDPTAWIEWLFGAVFAMTAATIVSGAVAGRMKFAAYVAFGLCMVTIIYPVVQGIAWQGGLLTADGYLGNQLGTGYIDFAGATVVHMVGGIAGLVAAMLVGPRRDRFTTHGKNAIPGHSVFLTMLGTFVLAFGWYGFNVGTQATVLTAEGTFQGEALGRVALNTTLGMGAGALAAAAVTAVYRGKADPVFTANGLLAGLVAVTGAAAYVTWWGGLLLGALGGAMVMPVHQLVINRMRIDDVCGVFAVHGFAGALGTVLLPLFAAGQDGSWQILGIDQLLMQILGVSVIALWTIGGTVLSLRLIKIFLDGDLRVDRESERIGLDTSEHNITAYPEFALTDGGTGIPSQDAVDEASNDAADDASSQSSLGDEAGMNSETTMWRGQEVEISRKTEYEQELEALTARLELALDETNTGVWEWDTRTDTHIWDEASERLFGYDSGEFPGTTAAVLNRIHPDDRPEVKRGIDEIFANKRREYSSLFRVLLPDDTQNWIRARGIVKYDDGEPVRILGVQTDITARKEREQVLETTKRELEQSNEKLRQKNERLDEFAGVISHDLRNPLSTAKTRLSLLEAEYKSEHTDAAMTALDRMEEIIDETLTLARQGEAVGETESVSVSFLAERCWGMIDTEQATLDVVDQFLVNADEDRLRHIFENLFRNAIEHGGADVTGRVGHDNDVLYIEDDGQGIPLEKRETVFKLGQTSSPDGTGFGLAIVQRIATAHGWEVSVTESADGGARFEFTNVEFVN